MESQFEENERNLEKLQKDLVSLACEMLIHLQVIESKSNFYRVCNPPTTWTPEETCRCEDGNMEPTCEPVTNIIQRKKRDSERYSKCPVGRTGPGCEKCKSQLKIHFFYPAPN